MTLNYKSPIPLTTGGTLVLREIPDNPDALITEALERSIPPHQGEFRHPRRVSEYYTTALMKRDLGIEQVISYHESGKPYLQDGPHISISHGKSLAGFVKSERPIGLDIQFPEEKLRTISTRFGHPEELEYARTLSEPLPYFTFLWSAKEALFKIYGEGLTFSTQIRVDLPPQENALTGAQVYHRGAWIEHQLEQYWLDGHIVVIAC